MIVTIQVENQRDYKWLLPFLEALKKNSSIKVEIKKSADENGWDDKLNDFFKFIEKRAIPVSRIEPLSRDELNER